MADTAAGAAAFATAAFLRGPMIAETSAAPMPRRLGLGGASPSEADTEPLPHLRREVLPARLDDEPADMK